MPLHPDYQTVTLPYQTSDDRCYAHQLIAGLVEHGLGFNAEMLSGRMVIRFTGGF